MILPRVTIICLCYNHIRYVEEAVQSALDQDYDNIEVIAIDDCSTDGSQTVLTALSKKHAHLKVILNSSNEGNCVAFNKAFALSTGDFVIDLAADDVLFPNRVSTGITELEAVGREYGVHYSDHEWIDGTGRLLGYQYDRNGDDGTLKNPPPSGDIYAEILERYFISAPTMMIRRIVLEKLGGYDESLTYEDFDFWIRSSRDWKYMFSNQVLVKKRLLRGSLSTAQFRFGSHHDRSTLKVCQNALWLNRNAEEHKALKRRLSYERNHALANGNLRLAKDYHGLIGKVEKMIKQTLN